MTQKSPGPKPRASRAKPSRFPASVISTTTKSGFPFFAGIFMSRSVAQTRPVREGERKSKKRLDGRDGARYLLFMNDATKKEIARRIRIMAATHGAWVKENAKSSQKEDRHPNTYAFCECSRCGLTPMRG